MDLLLSKTRLLVVAADIVSIARRWTRPVALVGSFIWPHWPR